MNKEINFDSLVICSTLNQMVNYVVIKEHDIKNVYNIRMKNNYSRSFNYDEWDKNIKECGALLDDVIFQDVKFDKSEIRNHKEIKDKLVGEFGGKASNGQNFKLKDEKILWNITGGQRHFVMAITDYVYNNRPDDVIVYFEGDNEKMYYYERDNSIREDDIYREDDYPMSIPLALRLMGFKLSKENEENIKNTSEYSKFLTSNNLEEFKTKCKNENISYIKNKSIEDTYETIKQEYDWYNEFYKLYVGNKTLRKLLINSNRFINIKDKTGEEIEVSILKRIKEEIKSCDEVYSKGKNNVFDEKRFSILEKSIGNHDTAKVFGYILEKMTFYKIIRELIDDELINEIADIDLSVKIKDLNCTKDEIKDEFDILIVTKKGKVIMFECKSGGMTGDNAKSHNYSTYSIAGVYGKPILISPLLESESCSNSKEGYSTQTVKALKDPDKPYNEDVYKYIRQATKSAHRAKLQICYIDKINNIINDLLN
ncbi:DNA-binding protein [Clostridium cochlearium]|uniref:DNA-binding protein n=1 Tax=Clostridium cochlearium TaxID=1494 RepID=UPI000BBC4B70|nr:DNA-binding protein [Clostridium cochlearium]